MHAQAFGAVVAALVGLMANAAMAAPIILGILEERLSGDWGSPLQTSIRVGFVKTGGEWAALNCEESEDASGDACRALGKPEAPVTWSVYYLGKLLGTVRSTSWAAPASAQKGTLAIAPGQTPVVGKLLKDFGGWMNTSAHRPLVAVNSAVPPFPSRWKRDNPHPELLAAAWPAYRAVVSSVDVCAKDPGAATRHVLRPTDMKAMPGWRSRSGELLLLFGVDPSLQANCEIRDDRTVWLFRSRDGNFRTLPGQEWGEREAINFTPGLKLLDAGDFAGDGGEEAVFFFSGYNFDGYILYYDNFRKATRFGWHYH